MKIALDMSTIQMVNGFDADLHWGCEPDNLPFLDESFS